MNTWLHNYIEKYFIFFDQNNLAESRIQHLIKYYSFFLFTAHSLHFFLDFPMPYIFPLHLQSFFIFYIKNGNHSKNVQSSHYQICNPLAPASNLFTEEVGKIFFLLAMVTLLFLYDFISLVIFSVLASLSSLSLPLCVSLSFCLSLSLSPLNGFHMPEVIPSQHVSHHDIHIKL